MVFDTGPRKPHEPRTSQPRAPTDDCWSDENNCDRCGKVAVSHCKSIREPSEADGYAAGTLIEGKKWPNPDMCVEETSRDDKNDVACQMADKRYQCDVMACQEAVRWSKKCRDDEAHFGADWNRALEQQRQQQRLSTLRCLASKATIALAAPMCFHVLRRYAVSRGFLLSIGSQQSGDLQSCYTQIPNLHEPQWLACPDALIFLAASMSAGVVLVHYHQINVGDKHQNLVLATLTSVALACGVYSGLTLMAANLTVTPWAVLTSLIVSDLLHAMLRARDVRKVQIMDNPDGARFGRPIGNA